jgi:hypothetical protein
VILTGEFSNQAKERIRKEIDNANIEFFDITWLVTKFTEHYPQIFFQGEILDFVIEKIKNLEKKHWLTQKNLNLSDYYIEPWIKKIEEPFKIDKTSSIKKEKEQKFYITGINSILKRNSKIILTGEPGSGKSMALAKIAINDLKNASVLKQISKYRTEKTEIPLLVHSRTVLASDNVKDLINHFLNGEYISFADEIKISKLLVDALDEVNQNQRMEVIDRVKKFTNELDCPVIITSRKIDIIRNLNINFENYELLPFKFNQVIKLCEKLVSDKECLGRIKKGLLDIEKQIPLIPLSLLLLIRIIEDRKEIPASIAEIYSRYFELVLGRWDTEKGLEIIVDYIVLDDFISELAYNEFFKKNKLQITSKDFKVYCEIYTQDHGWNNETLTHLIQSIRRSAILSINKKIEFKHKTFLEYFIAKSILDRREDIDSLEDFLVNIYFDETWNDVVFYYIGLQRKIKKIEFLDRIFNYKCNDINCLINKFMVGRLLQAGWYSNEKVQEFGITKTISFEESIRISLSNLLKKNDEVPLIVPDILLLFFSEISICSIFLLQTSKKVLNKLIQEMDNKSLFQTFILLWIINDLTPSNEYKKIVHQFYDKFDSLSTIDIQNQIRILLLLNLIEEKGEKIEKVIDKKLKKISKNNFTIIQKYLPKVSGGFRKSKIKK